MPDIINKMQCSVSHYLEYVDKNTRPLSSFSYFSLCDFPQLSFYFQIDHIRANQCSSVFQRLDWGSDTWSETLQKKTFRLCRLAGVLRGNVPLRGWLALGVFPRGLASWRFTQHCLTEPGLAGRITFHSRLKSLEIPLFIQRYRNKRSNSWPCWGEICIVGQSSIFYFLSAQIRSIPVIEESHAH